MLRRICICTALCSLLLRADFSYEQSSKITGGMLAGMMKVAGVFSSKARQPMKNTVLVKGDRMATVSGDSIHVIDLGKETMTAIDLDKKTYAVITFAEMAEAMAKMAERAGQKQSDPGAEMQFKFDVKDTGQAKTINGFNAKELIMTLEFEGKDKKTGETGALTTITEMWITPKIAGYDEVQNFYKRMAAKLAWTPGASILGGMAAARPEMTKAMAKMAEEGSKIDGIPVFQIVKMGAKGEGMQSGQSPAASSQQPQQPSAGAQENAASAALGKLGKLGGFGGFGRKKKEQPQEQPAAQQQAQADASGALMVMETELTNFSSAPVDSARFEVPAGFKQIEHGMKKALK